MTTLISDVRGEIAEVLQSVTGIRADGYVGMTQLAPPCFRVARGPYDPRYAFGSTKTQVLFTVVAFVSLSADRAGEKLLDTLADNSGTRSVRTALETLSNWTGVAIDTCEVIRVGEVTQVELGGAQYLANEFDVLVVF